MSADDMTMQGKEFPSFGKSFDTCGVMHAKMNRIGEMTVVVRGGPGRKTPE